MKEFTKEDIVKCFKDRPDNVVISQNEVDITVRVENMFDYVTLNFGVLEKLADVFGTRNFNVGSQHIGGWCETCDYGSQYVLEFSIPKDGREVNLFTGD